EFSFEPDGAEVPTGRENLIVRAFESLRPADGLALPLRSEIPLPRGPGAPPGRETLTARAFESRRPADGLAFRLRSEIPLARGLGSSAAAIVAGLVAADHLFELALTREELLARATEIEGHPDNVA